MTTRRFPPPWSVEAEKGKMIKTRASNMPTTGPRDNGGQSTEYCNFRNGHSVIPAKSEQSHLGDVEDCRRISHIGMDSTIRSCSYPDWGSREALSVLLRD